MKKTKATTIAIVIALTAIQVWTVEPTLAQSKPDILVSGAMI